MCWILVYCSIPEVTTEKSASQLAQLQWVIVTKLSISVEKLLFFLFFLLSNTRTTVKNVNDSHAGSRNEYGCFIILPEIFPSRRNKFTLLLDFFEFGKCSSIEEQAKTPATFYLLWIFFDKAKQVMRLFTFVVTCTNGMLLSLRISLEKQ